MAIRFTNDYNKRIRRLVSNFNRRRSTAIKSGIKGTPEKVFVKELKRRYDKREDLNRELKLLEEFTRKTLKTVETENGVKTNQWNLEYIKSNLEVAKVHFDKEVAILSERVATHPGQRDALNTALKNKSVLEYDLNNLSQEQYDSLTGAIRSYVKARNAMGSGYRGFLSEVEQVMGLVGVPEETKNQFFKKINTLNQQQFFYMYEKSDLIKRIYDLYEEKDGTGKIRLNTTQKDASDLINILLEEIDVLVDEAKNKA